jgi:hypothetical protein
VHRHARHRSLSFNASEMRWCAVPDKPTLYVCHIDTGGPAPHACRRAQRALREAGVDFDKVVYGRGKLFGLFTKGTRPDLKEMSGQEKLPVLKLADGSTVSGSSEIVAWARSNAPAAGTADAA